MITVEQTPLSPEEDKTLKDWLGADGAILMRAVVRDQIAALEAKATQLSDKRAAEIMVREDISPDMKNVFVAASLLKVFLNNFDILSDEKNFSRVTLKSQ